VKTWFRQLRDAWTHMRTVDDHVVWMVPLGAAVGLLAGVGLGFLFPFATFVMMPVFGVLLAFVGAMMVFNRRARKAQYQLLDGQLGAAAAVLDQLRGQWFLSPAVAVNTKQDMVHRLVGRCGVVLVGEGAQQRVKPLLAKERKRLARVVGDAPVTVLVVGEREGQVPLRKLQLRITKLPAKLKKAEVPRLERKLKPLDKAPPIPKGIDPMAAASRKRPKPR